MKIFVKLILVLYSGLLLAADPAVDALPDSEATVAPADRTIAGTVRRAHFTTGIEAHEPIDNLLSLSNKEQSVYFYTDLRGFEGQVITHRWIYDEQVLADVKFDVGGPRWRVWSKKTLLPFWTGNIHVNVIDEDGRVLESKVLEYIDAGQ